MLPTIQSSNHITSNNQFNQSIDEPTKSIAHLHVATHLPSRCLLAVLLSIRGCHRFFVYMAPICYCDPQFVSIGLLNLCRILEHIRFKVFFRRANLVSAMALSLPPPPPALCHLASQPRREAAGGSPEDVLGVHIQTSGYAGIVTILLEQDYN